MPCEKDGKWYFLAFYGIIKKDMTDASSRVNNGSPEKSDGRRNRMWQLKRFEWELLLFSMSRDQEAYVWLQMMMHHLYNTDLQTWFVDYGG